MSIRETVIHSRAAFQIKAEDVVFPVQDGMYGARVISKEDQGETVILSTTMGRFTYPHTHRLDIVDVWGA